MDGLATLPLEELTRITWDHGPPFDSRARAAQFIRYASVLRHRLPEEADHGGQRVRTRDLDAMIQQARKALAVATLAARGPTVIASPPTRIARGA